MPDESPQTAPTQSLADWFRADLAKKRGDVTDLWNNLPQRYADSVQKAHDTARSLLSTFPEPGLRDQAGDSVDLLFNTLDSLSSPDKMDAHAASVGKGVQQAATGFNEGLASTVARPLDVIPYLVSRAMGGEGVHPAESTFRKYFVDPAGEPSTRMQKIVRAGGNVLGENVPALASGAGLATSGLRSGVTLAEQAANGLVNGISSPAASVGGEAGPTLAARLQSMVPKSVYQAFAPTPPNASGVRSLGDQFMDAINPVKLAGRLTSSAANAAGSGIQKAVSNVADTASAYLNPGELQNAFSPSNIVNAVRPANLQAAADYTLDAAANNPTTALGAGAYRAFRKGERAERTRQASASTPPLPQSVDVPSTSPDYYYTPF